MALRQKDIDRLECMFTEECVIAIDNLVFRDMTDEQYEAFQNSLKTFLKYEDIKEFVVGEFLSRFKARLRYFAPNKNDRAPWSNFRRLSKLAVKFCDQTSLEFFSTHVLTENLPDHFLVLLEEMVQANISTAPHQKVFESLICIHRYNIGYIKKYLSIVKQDGFGLACSLLKNSNYAGLITYIRLLNEENGRGQFLKEQIIPSILENYTGDRTHYLAISMAVAEGGSDFLKELMTQCDHVGEVERHFAGYLASNQIHNTKALKGFMSYLQDNNPAAISSFEDHLLKDSRSHLLIKYVEEVPNSNKRKVLIRLIDIGEERYVVEFIKKFPAYSSLMPML